MDQIEDLPALLTSLAFPTGDSKAYAQNDATLQSCLKVPGFLNQLHVIVADVSGQVPREVRLLASLVVARELPKKWRARSVISDDAKPEFRRRFFQFFDESDYQIARSQLRLLVMIARQDYPRQWPSLLQDMLVPLQESATYILGPAGATAGPERSHQKTRLLNAFWTWNAFVKEWRSVRLPVGAVLMKDLILNMRGPMMMYLESLMARDPSLEDWELLDSARYAFKTCARLLEWQFSRPKTQRVDSDPAETNALIQHSLQYLAKLQTFRLQLLDSPLFANPQQAPPEAVRLLKSLTAFIRTIGKNYEALMHIDPKAFAAIDGTISAIGWWWGEVSAAVKQGLKPREDDDTARYPKRFMLLGLILFKNILPILSTEHRETVFTDEFITSAFTLILDDLLPLSEEDWEAWQADPEDWIMQQLDKGQVWSYEFRPCSERVLMGLTSAARDRNVMEPLMIARMQDALHGSRNDFPSRVRWETVLTGAGRMARSLSARQLQLSDFLPILAPIADSADEQDRILKYRLAWFIGQWVSADEESAKLQGVWDILLRLLCGRDDSSDIAVNISAALAIKECVDLWEMPVSYFEQYIGQIVEQLLRLIGEAETLEGKRTVLDVLSILIERVAKLILPYADVISQAVPILWQGSATLDGEWIFKASLVTLSTRLITAMGPDCARILHLIVPLIEESLVNAGHLEEDGLDLWEAALVNIPSLETSGKLANLVDFLINLLGRDLDSLAKALRLTESYMLLDGAWLFSTHGPALSASILTALNSVDKQKVKSVLSCVDLATQTAPSSAWGPAFASSGLFNRICDGLDDEKAAGIVLAGYLTSISRMILSDSQMFFQLVQHLADTKSEPARKQLETTFDAMWRAFDYLSEGASRKVIALALAALLPLGIPQVFERLDGEFVNVWLDVLGEMKESLVEGQAGTEVLRHWEDDHQVAYLEIQGTEEYARRKRVEQSDPIYTQLLTTYVAARLSEAQAVGMAPYFDKLDDGVKNSLQKLLA